MGQNKYLAYVREQYDRERHKAKIAGVTTWGLLIAIVYLIWNIMPEYSLIRDKSALFNKTVNIYGCLQIFILFLFMIFSMRFRGGNVYPFDVRLKNKYSDDPYGVFIAMAMLIILPVLAQNYDNNPSNWFVNFQRNFNLYVLSIIIFIGYTVEIVCFIYEKNTG